MDDFLEGIENVGHEVEKLITSHTTIQLALMVLKEREKIENHQKAVAIWMKRLEEVGEHIATLKTKNTKLSDNMLHFASIAVEALDQVEKLENHLENILTTIEVFLVHINGEKPSCCSICNSVMLPRADGKGKVCRNHCEEKLADER